MSLPEPDRAEVAAQLQASIGSARDSNVPAAWEAEIAERLKAIDDGHVELVPAEDVHRELRQKYGFFKG